MDGGVVDEHVSGAAAGVAYQWYALELLLHEPLEVVVEVSEYGPDVEGSLVVGHEDIALPGVEVLAARYFYAHAEEEAHAARPDVGGPVGEHDMAAQGRADDGGQGG